MLDGLRGVAAIAVAIYHACSVFGATQLLPKAFLAVDFFFLLSGIVVAHAYERRLKQGQIREYIERRLIRLYPMILIGALLGMSVIILAMRLTVSSRQGRVLAWLGAVSYPVYAIHSPLFLWLARLQRATESRFQVSPYWWIVIAVAFALVCAWIAYKIYDLPLREALTAKMRRRCRSHASTGTP